MTEVQLEEETTKEALDQAEKPSRARVAAYVGANIIGIAFVLIGVSLLFWIARPYLTLYLSASAREALENKVKEKPTPDNRIIIPAVLVDAPINEGFTEESLKTGAGHISSSAVPGQNGNIILAGHNYAYFVQGGQNLFSLLHLIRKNTRIYIFWEGKRYVYKSVDKTTVPRDDAAIFAQTSYPSLTLIASASSWDAATISSTRRLLVKALPVKK